MYPVEPSERRTAYHSELLVSVTVMPVPDGMTPLEL